MTTHNRSTQSLRNQILENQEIIDELNEKLARKTQEIRIIQEISSEITSTLDLDKMLNIILHSMDKVLGFKSSMILLLNESGEKLTVAASCGYEESGVGSEVIVGQGVIGVVAKRRKIIRMGNIGASMAYIAAVRARMKEAGHGHETVKLPGLPNVQSQIGIPLLAKNKLIGVFAVESPQPNAFDELDEVLLIILANQAAISIDNARLYSNLEHRVVERTQELREKNGELENTLQQLRDMQHQLIMQEKMAALGNLVAGLAHEMNNPIGAINSTIDLSSRCLDKIASALETSITLDDLKKDKRFQRSIAVLQKTHQVVSTASHRITHLVNSLKNFARLDEAEFQKTDIHDGIDSTLTLVSHELKNRVKVIRKYGNIPQIYCYPNELNQVFMNLIVNAASAIEGQGTITIQTFADDSHVHVKIADTGMGIASENLTHIFEPGFTTKASGTGTGLGLSISYNIIQKHNGEIKVESEVGKGTEFVITLPIMKKN